MGFSAVDVILELHPTHGCLVEIDVVDVLIINIVISLIDDIH